MDIGRQRAAEREPIGSGLLLDDAPLWRLALLHGDEAIHQLGPLDAGIGLDDAALGIQAKLAPHRARIDHDRTAGELLAAHGMTAARDRNRLSVAPGGLDGGSQRRLRLDRDHAIDACLVELGVHVVDQRAAAWGRRRCGSIRQERKTGSGPHRAVQDVASCSHVASRVSPRAAAKIISMATAWTRW